MKSVFKTLFTTACSLSIISNINDYDDIVMVIAKFILLPGLVFFFNKLFDKVID